jgi:hypothetical protein
VQLLVAPLGCPNLLPPGCKISIRLRFNATMYYTAMQSSHLQQLDLRAVLSSARLALPGCEMALRLRHKARDGRWRLMVA